MRNIWKSSVSFLASLGIVALAATSALAVPANPPPPSYAYGPQGYPIAPLYSGLTGSYAKALTSGTIGAGASAGAIVYDFQYTGSGVAVVKRISISVADAGTGFAAGPLTLSAYAARAFTAADTGGTAGALTGNNAKLRTAFATTGVGAVMVATTSAMSAGTRTLDTDPLGAVTFGTPTTAGLNVGQLDILAAKNAGDYPFVAATNEGFEIQATVPATGTWVLTVYVEWDEYTNF